MREYLYSTIKWKSTQRANKIIETATNLMSAGITLNFWNQRQWYRSVYTINFWLVKKNKHFKWRDWEKTDAKHTMRSIGISYAVY